MSKKHFIRLARIMAEAKLFNSADIMWNHIYKELEILCKQENPLFDSDKFLEACNADI